MADEDSLDLDGDDEVLLWSKIKSFLWYVIYHT